MAKSRAKTSTAAQAQKALRSHADKSKAKIASRFFKAEKGGYGEGDVFHGVQVPTTRTVAKAFRGLPLEEAEILLRSRFHEERLLALFILVWQFSKADSAQQRKIHLLYLKNLDWVNNWDLVDSSAEHLVGGYLFERNRALLHRLSKSKDVWRRRVAIMSTFHFIKKGDHSETLRLAQMLLRDEHDLIHKAVGWMLREIGNRAPEVEREFLLKHAAIMPRTMLRYAIEKFPKSERSFFMALKVKG